jgi:hypothetical protein
MRVRKVIRKVTKRDDDGVQVSSDINAVVSTNVNEPGSRTHASSKQRVGKITQRRKRDG